MGVGVSLWGHQPRDGDRGQSVGGSVGGGVFHDDNDDADVPPQGRPDFVALRLKILDLCLCCKLQATENSGTSV